MKRLIPLACLGLAACASTETTRRAGPDIAMPAMNTFAAKGAQLPDISNTVIARDYLDLVFRLENGAQIQTFTRFDGPITVGVAGPTTKTLNRDLDHLLSRLRREAGLDITRAKTVETPSITVIPVPRAQIQKVAPTAACFVRANVSSWDEYRQRRKDPATQWTRLTKRERMAVFLPSDVSPQEIRDCLHEEIAQALGPVNDLYRLPNSIFNDDNFHTVLTGYDMLILATHYDPALSSGMSRQQVASRLPAILNRINPRGARATTRQVRPSPPDFTRSINAATTPTLSRPRRLAQAERAVAIARGFGPNDPRLGYAHYVLGRLALSSDPDLAFQSFLAAGKIYERRPDTRIQEAHVALQVAAFQLSLGRADVAIALVDQNLAAVNRAEHAALLSLMLMVKAEALELLDRKSAAAAVQKEALGWALYGFGDEDIVRTRVGEILAISPRTRERQAL